MRYKLIFILFLLNLFPIICLAQISNTNVENIKYVPAEVIVRFRKGYSKRKITAFNTSYGLSTIKVFPHLNVFHLKASKNLSNLKKILESYKTNPNVLYAEPNYIYYPYSVPNDELLSKQWALSNIEATRAWEIEKGKAKIIIAIVDTGVNWNHPDLVNKIWNNKNEIPNDFIDNDNNGYTDDIRGWDIADNDNDPMDEYGHGTHCAGISAAESNNFIGIAGLAQKCTIMPVKIDSSYWERSFTAVVCAEGIIYAVNNGANVINMSWGGPADSYLIHDAIRYAYDNNVVLVAAAGNSNDDFSGFPACYNEVISVSATDYYDKKAFFSSYGPFVDVAAPGTEILSTYRDASYESMSGTSMASPYVAGLSGLILSYKPDLTNEQVRQAIRISADNFETNEWDPYYGYGRINAYNALRYIQTTTPIEMKITSPISDELVNGVVDIKGTVNGLNLQNHEIEYGKGLTPNQWNKTGIFVTEWPVKNGLLGKWHTEDLAEGRYTLRIRAYSTSGKIYEDRAVVIVNKNSSTINSTSKLTNSPVLYDLDNDGAMEIIQISNDWDFDQLNIYKSNGTSINPGWPKKNKNFWYGWALPIIGDVDGNGLPEVLSIVDTDVYGWKVDGTSIPNFPIKNKDVWSKVSLGDINNDENLEMVFVSIDGFMYVIDSKGTILPGWPQELKGFDSYTESACGIADINGDGYNDIAITTEGGQVYVFNHLGVLLPGWPQVMDDVGYSELALGDVDGDGEIEIICVSPGWYYNKPRVYVWKNNGILLPGWPQVVGGRPTAPVLGNLDYKGGLEILIGCADHRVYVWHSDGSLVTGWPQQIDDAITMPPAIGDIDGDGEREVIVNGNRDNKVYAWHSNGEVVSGWPKSTGSYNITTPAIGDVTGDGRVDVITSSADGNIYIFHCKGNYIPENIDWAMRCHDPQNSCFTAYRKKSKKLFSSLDNAVVYPNPFKPNDNNIHTGTWQQGIYFSNLTENNSIRIYNVAGELVAEMRKNDLYKNKYQWIVDRKIASGVYMYVIEDEDTDKKITGKLSIIK